LHEKEARIQELEAANARLEQLQASWDPEREVLERERNRDSEAYSFDNIMALGFE